MNSRFNYNDPKNWPNTCEVNGCTDPSLQPHHHHEYGWYMSILACTCGNPEWAGTRPKDV